MIGEILMADRARDWWYGYTAGFVSAFLLCAIIGMFLP